MRGSATISILVKYFRKQQCIIKLLQSKNRAVLYITQKLITRKYSFLFFVIILAFNSYKKWIICHRLIMYLILFTKYSVWVSLFWFCVLMKVHFTMQWSFFVFHELNLPFFINDNIFLLASNSLEWVFTGESFHSWFMELRKAYNLEEASLHHYFLFPQGKLVWIDR